MFCNAVLVAIVLKAGGLSRLSVQNSQDDESINVKVYLVLILWSVAGLSAFKFLGSMWYKIHRIVSNSMRDWHELLLTCFIVREIAMVIVMFSNKGFLLRILLQRVINTFLFSDLLALLLPIEMNLLRYQYLSGSFCFVICGKYRIFPVSSRERDNNHVQYSLTLFRHGQSIHEMSWTLSVYNRALLVRVAA